MPDLPDCPFCGEQPSIYINPGIQSDHRAAAWCETSTCPIEDIRMSAIEWQTRPTAQGVVQVSAAEISDTITMMRRGIGARTAWINQLREWLPEAQQGDSEDG